MSGIFDVYLQWLDIPPHEQPPNHYRLLDIPLFESDPSAIRAAADQRMTRLRALHLGQHAGLSQRILNEIAAAKICLLDQNRRRDYDEWLRNRLQAVSPMAPVAIPPPSPASIDVAVVVPAPAETAAGSPVAAIPRHMPRPRRVRLPVGKFLFGAFCLVAVICGLVIAVQRSRRPTRDDNGPTPIALPEDNSQSLAGKTVIVPEHTVVQGDDGYLVLDAADALVDRTDSQGGADLQGQAVLEWTRGIERVKWNCLVRRPGIFMIEVTYAAAAEAAGGSAQITINKRLVNFQVRDTGGWDKFVTDPAKMVKIGRSGRYELVVEPREMPTEQLMQLKGLRLRPAPVGVGGNRTSP